MQTENPTPEKKTVRHHTGVKILIPDDEPLVRDQGWETFDNSNVVIVEDAK